MAELLRGDAGPELNQYNTDSARASDRVGSARQSLHTARVGAAARRQVQARL